MFDILQIYFCNISNICFYILLCYNSYIEEKKICGTKKTLCTQIKLDNKNN